LDEDDDTLVYAVVFNDEEQYSIWPAHKPIPPGWTGEGTTGRKAACLSRIEEVWTDMRPLSVRKAMAAAQAASGPEGAGRP
jgi:MbtH protein